MINDTIIAEAIRCANKDKYGQTPVFNKQVCHLFSKDMHDEVIEYLKISPKYELSTYGNSIIGIYKAISLR